uniref:Uncharacterized protein n=1 Tax=Rhizophora mucronata TaxID=61149 RepID=A0A2P2KZ39_RHIMU
MMVGMVIFCSLLDCCKPHLTDCLNMMIFGFHDLFSILAPAFTRN